MARTRVLFMELKAVSVAEKYADSASSAAIINIFLTKSSIAHVATVTFHFSYITFLFLLAQTHLL
jgi:hypothetical protein